MNDSLVNSADRPRSAGGVDPAHSAGGVDRTQLVELARAHGVADTYVGWDRLDHDVSSETIVSVLSSLGLPTSEPNWVADALGEFDLAPWRLMLPAVVVAIEGSGHRFAVHVPHWDPVHVVIVTEGGQTVEVAQCDNWVDPREVDGVLTGRATFEIPRHLATGYHWLHARNTATDETVASQLIVTPARLHTADALGDRQRWGLAVQLYSIRSARSWGVGDFGDLAAICEVAGRTYGADFVQINPLHAAQPVAPIEESPYLPSTRRFVNPLYIRVTEIPEVAGLGKAHRTRLKSMCKDFSSANASVKKIKRNKSFRAKLAILEAIHEVPLDDVRAESYAAFREREGDGLRRFATWCALAEKYGPDSPKWGRQLLDQTYVARKTAKLARRIEFFSWLQWICDEQLAQAQAAAVAAGMSIGVVADLAVGVGQRSADTWALGEVLTDGVTVGAPPDGFNQQGQNWDQPPWHPTRLAQAGYVPYRDMLRTVLRHAGGVRVDHILGLFRLWWIPAGRTAAEGTYVRYDHQALVGILALEAQRAGAVVIGEDLGVFEPVVQTTLAQRGILGTSILWFEHGEFAPIAPEDYRQLCLTSVTTHDLPPTVGYLAGDHIELRSKLGILETSEQEERIREEGNRDAILQLARDRGLLDADASLVDQSTVEALYRLIAVSPSALLGVALVDAVGERRIQNQPGTDSQQYPNWCIPLADDTGRAVSVEDLATNARFASLVAALNDSGVGR